MRSQTANQQSEIDRHRAPRIPKPEPRHFACELFSAGPRIRQNGRELREIPVVVSGAWVKGGHHFSISSADLQAILRNFEKRKNDMVVIDYEHASEDPSVARGGPVPAAGWIHSLSVARRPRSAAAENGTPAAETLTALVEWTPEARDLIESGKYRFFSPSIDWGARDKETGQPQGATLTSGALTNHPFLEELPPLMLTDLTASSREAPNQESAGRDPGKGETEMEMKRLSIRKLSEGAQAGHHGVFYGDDLVGYMTDEDFCKYARKHLTPEAADPVGSDGSETAAGLSMLFAERVGATGAALDEIRELVESGRRAQARDQEASARALILSEVVHEGRLRTERALELARDQKITLADFVAVQAAERSLERAVAEGKVLPRDRHFFFRDALERPREFSEFVERAAPVVRLGSEGIGCGEAMPVDQEVDLGARRLMSEQKLSYGKALKALFRENPALESRYRSAHKKQLGASADEAVQ